MTDIAPQPDLEYFTSPTTGDIAIRDRPAGRGRSSVVFLPGYASDMDSQKASAIDAFCAARGHGCLRMDYSGTGSSPGEFGDGTLGRWLDEVIALIDARVAGPVLLAGSSMGAWLALHVALRRPARVAALLGIAAAPDFTDWGFGARDREALALHGRIERGGLLTTVEFWKSGEALRLLGSPIDIAVPVRLVHGTKDEAVPMAVVLTLLDRLGSGDVQLRLIKDAGHRLSAPREIDAILAELAGLLDTVQREVPAR